MRILNKLIRTKNLPEIFINLLGKMNSKKKLFFVQISTKLLLEESIKGLSIEEREVFLDAVYASTSAEITKLKKLDARNPDYMCC